eukprot:650296-Heterocapsa_arctica.AAC.1
MERQVFTGPNEARTQVLSVLVHAQLAGLHQGEEDDGRDPSGPQDDHKGRGNLHADRLPADACLAVAVLIGHAAEAAPTVE